MSEPANDDLDTQVRRADPDRWLSSRFIADRQARADVIALYAYDHELARAPRVASNPLLAEIRLTWWREVLDEIFEGRPVRRHPTAEALAETVRRRGLPREPLEAMIDARIEGLNAGHDPLKVARQAAGSAAVLAARILDPHAAAEAARSAGAAWALARGGDADRAQAALIEARADVRRLSVRAFPAVAHAALMRATDTSELEKRLRLTWAALRGKI